MISNNKQKLYSIQSMNLINNFLKINLKVNLKIIFVDNNFYSQLMRFF